MVPWYSELLRCEIPEAERNTALRFRNVSVMISTDNTPSLPNKATYAVGILVLRAPLSGSPHCSQLCLSARRRSPTRVEPIAIWAWVSAGTAASVCKASRAALSPQCTAALTPALESSVICGAVALSAHEAAATNASPAPRVLTMLSMGIAGSSSYCTSSVPA